MSLVSNPQVVIVGDVRHNTTQSVLSSVNTPVIFNVEDFQTGIRIHSTTVNPTRFTNRSGVTKTFRFSASVIFEASPVGDRFVFFAVNGATGAVAPRFGQTSFNPMPMGRDISNISTQIELKNGEFTECFVFQDSASPLNIGSVLISLNNRCEYNEILTEIL